MKILIAADGTEFTKKALAFLVTQGKVGDDDELLVLNVQPAVAAEVIRYAGAGTVADWQRDEAQKVLAPIGEFLERHKLRFTTKWVVGYASDEIVRAAVENKAAMIVMGTHGHGLLGRALMGSVAQKVVTDSPVPVLLAK